MSSVSFSCPSGTWPVSLPKPYGAIVGLQASVHVTLHLVAQPMLIHLVLCALALCVHNWANHVTHLRVTGLAFRGGSYNGLAICLGRPKDPRLHLPSWWKWQLLATPALSYLVPTKIGLSLVWFDLVPGIEPRNA